MNFSMTAGNSTFHLNPSRAVRRALPRIDDVVTAQPDVELARLKATLERNLVSTTSRTVLPLDYLLQIREPYIRLRNAILDNPFRFFNRTWKEKLSEIDSKLDEVDLEIYALVGNPVPQKDLEKVILEAQKTIQEAILIAKTSNA